MPIEAPTARPAGARAALQLSLALGLTVAFGVWGFRGVQWAQLWASLQLANYLWLIPHVALLLVVHFLRAYRYGVLLSGLGRVPFAELNRASAVGNMLFLVLPLRLGELARPVLISRKTELPFGGAVVGIALERILDGVVVAALLELALLLVPPMGQQGRLLQVLAHVALGGFVALWALLIFFGQRKTAVERLLDATIGRFSERLSKRMSGLFNQFAEGVSRMPRGRTLVATLALSVLLWAINGFAVWVLALAFRCDGTESAACLPLYLTVRESFVVLGVTTFGGLIPAAPGMAGTFQASVRLSLSPFVPLAVAVGPGLAFANVLWACTVLHQIALGLIWFRSAFAGRAGNASSVLAP